MKQHHFDNGLGLSGVQVDRGNGIIRGVSVITAGVTAIGHNLEVDMTTLHQIKQCAEKMGTVPTKWNHKTGADAVNGYLKDFYLEGKQLKADWHLLKTHSQFEQAMELAERMPKNVGLSAAFMGEDEPIEKDGQKTMAARCDSLVSVDLVASPAANPNGLLAAKFPGDPAAAVDAQAGNDTLMDPKNPTTEAPTEPSLQDVMNALNTITSRLDAQEQALADLHAAGQDEPSLEEILSLSEQQIAELVQAGEITEEDAAGIAALQAEYAAGDGDGEGAPAETTTPAEVGAPAGGEGGTALGAVQRQLKALSARLDSADRARDEAEAEHHFATIETTLKELSAERNSLKELSERQAAQIEAMRHALRTGVRPVSFSAEAPNPMTATKEGKVHEFEALVESKVKEGLSKGKAFSAAITSRPDLHADWLDAASGARR